MRVPRGAARAVVLALTVFAAQGARADPDPGPNGIAAKVAALEATISTLQAQVAALQASPVLALGPYVSVDPDPVNGLKGPHVFFTGVNVHVRSGSGSTYEVGVVGTPPHLAGPLTGLGNLVIGYNEPRPERPDGEPPPGRDGSHNLIVGPYHGYTSAGGFVAGFANDIFGLNSSVSGGSSNTASGDGSSLSGGSANTASGYRSGVSGGTFNRASGDFSSVNGGSGNTASGVHSSVSGGVFSTASGADSSVNGGTSNRATGNVSSVCGGAANTASGYGSSVSGGSDREAPGLWDWAAGEFFSDQ